MNIIIADTNALIAPFKLKFNIDVQLADIFGSYEIVVPKPITGELEKLGKTNVHARAALKLAQTRKIMPTKSPGDDSVLELARKLEAWVMTNDRELISRARKQNLRVLRIKEGGRLAPDKDWMLR